MSVITKLEQNSEDIRSEGEYSRKDNLGSVARENDG